MGLEYVDSVEGGCEDLLEVGGNLYGSGMGCHGNILLKTNLLGGGERHRQNT